MRHLVLPPVYVQLQLQHNRSVLQHAACQQLCVDVSEAQLSVDLAAAALGSFMLV